MSPRHRPAVRPTLVVPLTVVAALAACHGDATGPITDRHPGIVFAAGANAADTIGTELLQALKVVVRDAKGSLLPNTIVRFASIPAGTPGTSLFGPSVLVGALAGRGASTFLAETTNTDGAVFVRIVLGNVAGPGAVAVTVPEAGLTDTARFTIRPGNAYVVVVTPGDTAMMTGNSLTLKGEVHDRWGNARSDAVAYRATNATLSVSSAGAVTAANPTRGAVVASAGDSTVRPDTAWVSVVPHGTVAAIQAGKLVTMQLDGSAYHVIPATGVIDAGLEWKPDGSALLVALNSQASPLDFVDRQGAITPVLPARTTDANNFSVPGALGSFDLSADAATVFVSANNCNSNSILYRYAVGADSLERLSPTSTTDPIGWDCFDVVERSPSVSPDGKQLVYERDSSYYSGFVLERMDLATKVVTDLNVAGQQPRYSPAGDLVAFFRANQIFVMQPDGTGVRAISPAGHTYLPGVRWSPDGRWLIARMASQYYGQGEVVLLDVQTGQEIPLPFTAMYSGYGLPVFQP